MVPLVLADSTYSIQVARMLKLQHPPKICLPDGTWFVDTPANQERAREIWILENEQFNKNENKIEAETENVHERVSETENEHVHQNKIEINNERTEDSENEYVNKGAKKSPDQSDIEMLRERERAEQEDESKMHKESLGKMRRAHKRRQQRALKEQQRRDQRARTGRDNRERLSGQFVSNNIFAVLATTDFAGSSGAGSNSNSHSGSTEQKTVTSQNAGDE